MSEPILCVENLGKAYRNYGGEWRRVLSWFGAPVKPIEGSMRINGRISAILELGMGFNPEFTGRRNAYHSAGLMGFSQEEIEKVMPEIESFAEIGAYFDEPLRTYSSGMQVRGMCAVATAWRPE